MRSSSVLRPLVLAAVLVLSLCVGVTHAQMEMPPRSLGDVIGHAEAEETPILLEIYAPWCPYCQKMQETVYADTEVRSYLDRTFTYARLNRDTTGGSHEFNGRMLSSKQLGMALGARGDHCLHDARRDAHRASAWLHQAASVSSDDSVRGVGGVPGTELQSVSEALVRMIPGHWVEGEKGL